MSIDAVFDFDGACREFGADLFRVRVALREIQSTAASGGIGSSGLDQIEALAGLAGDKLDAMLQQLETE